MLSQTQNVKLSYFSHVSARLTAPDLHIPLTLRFTLPGETSTMSLSRLYLFNRLTILNFFLWKPTEGTGYDIIFKGTYLKMPQSQREKNPRCYKKLHNSLSVLMPTKVGANIFWQPYNGPICVHLVYNQANKAVHHIYYLQLELFISSNRSSLLWCAIRYRYRYSNFFDTYSVHWFLLWLF